MINYKKLFERLKREKALLCSIVSKSVKDKIKSGGYIRLGTLEKICKMLNCQPDDIVSFIIYNNER